MLQVKLSEISIFSSTNSYAMGHFRQFLSPYTKCNRITPWFRKYSNLSGRSRSLPTAFHCVPNIVIHVVGLIRSRVRRPEHFTDFAIKKARWTYFNGHCGYYCPTRYHWLGFDVFLFLYALHVSGITFSHLQERHYTWALCFNNLSILVVSCNT
jgi:hypothetical protein